MKTEKELAVLANQLRIDVLELARATKSGHIGGSMSCMDILVTLYYKLMNTDKILLGAPDRDRFILSKGHCAHALYAVLASCGFFPKDDLKECDKLGSKYAEHPTKHINGIELSSGSLGHGISVGTGMALTFKRDGNPAKVYVLVGDGELGEGSNWEAAMSAAKYSLDNLTVIVDRNRLQISGSTEYVMPLDNLSEKFSAFGFAVTECDGHDFTALEEALKYKTDGKPHCVIANTVKGKGSAVMENKAGWHHKVPGDEEYVQIKSDLERLIMEAEA